MRGSADVFQPARRGRSEGRSSDMSANQHWASFGRSRIGIVSLRIASTAAALGLASLAGCRDRSPLEVPVTPPVTPPVAQPETNIRIFQGNGARLNPGSQVDTILIWVSDRHADSVPPSPVAWSVTSGGGSVVPIDTVTSGGFARAVWTLGPGVGVNTLLVSSAKASATLTAEAAAPLKAISMAPGAATPARW